MKQETTKTNRDMSFVVKGVEPQKDQGRAGRVTIIIFLIF